MGASEATTALAYTCQGGEIAAEEGQEGAIARTRQGCQSEAKEVKVDAISITASNFVANAEKQVKNMLQGAEGEPEGTELVTRANWLRRLAQ